MFLYELDKEYKEDRIITECKIKLDTHNTEEVLKTIVSFANTKGGDLYIGVEEKSNKVFGINSEDIKNIRCLIKTIVHDYIFPLPYFSSQIISYIEQGKEKYIIKLHVEESTTKPIQLSYKGHEEYYKRRDGYNSQYTLEELRNEILNSNYSSYSYAMGRTDITYKKEDFSTLHAVYKEKNKGEELREQLLESIGFLSSNNTLTNGALLFKDDYKEGSCDIELRIYPSLYKNEFREVESEDFNGNLLNAIKTAYCFVVQNMNRSYEKLSFTRRD